MPPNVDTVAVMPDGARDAANLMAGLEHNGMYIGTAKEFQGSVSPAGPAPMSRAVLDMETPAAAMEHQ